jgi:hypothetical protein
VIANPRRDRRLLSAVTRAILETVMRSIHDALRASQHHLPPPLRHDLARLFAEEELLARLSTRLLVFARQGVPASQPPPAFSAECTPPLAEAFAFFQPAVAAWHDTPDSPAVPAMLADALAAAGIRNVLVLLGQRMTPASLIDASALPPARERLLASALRPYSDTDRLSVAARALSKHAPRSTGTFWGKVAGSVDDKNATAGRLLEQILDQTTWWNVFGHYKHVLVYEARVATGHGARWGHGGDEFIGFLEPFEEER